MNKTLGYTSTVDLYTTRNNYPKEWIQYFSSRFITNDRILDLIELSYLVIIADEIFPKKSIRAYQRRITIKTPVRDPEFWLSKKHELESMVNFLSSDNIDFEFVQYEQLDKLPLTTTERSVYYKNRVTLFSGGMDSYIGCLDECTNHPDDVAIYSFSQTLGFDIKKLQDDLSITIPNFPVGHWERDTSQNLPLPDKPRNTEMRKITRMLRYITNAYALAYGVSANDLIIYENGVIGHGISYSLDRLGAGITKSTHPKFLADFMTLANAASGRQITLSTPYHELTKAQIINKSLTELGSTQENLFKTISCSNLRFYKRNGKQCGKCVPCIIRRIAERTAFRDYDVKESLYEHNPQAEPGNEEFNKNVADLKQLSESVTSGALTAFKSPDLSYLDIDIQLRFKDVISEFHNEINGAFP